MVPFWIPITTTTVAAVVAIWVDILTGRRKRAKSRREAVVKFRAAFAKAITQLDTIDAHSFITEARVQHDAAILEFRRFVDAEQIQHFVAAVRKLIRCRIEIQPA